MVPEFWHLACGALSDTDATLRGIIAASGDAVLRRRDDPFFTLARAIVGQQISVKAADTIWSRLVAHAGVIEPTAILKLPFESHATIGLSARKAEYLTELALHFDLGAMDPQAWLDMDDRAVIDDLVQLRGIGRWTSEMLLIFNLQRPDVLPLDDIGLLRAIGIHYLNGAMPTRAQAQQIAERWRPWRSVATWYLWRSLDPVPVEY